MPNYNITLLILTMTVGISLIFFSCSGEQSDHYEQGVTPSSITIAEAAYRDLSHMFTVSAEVEPYRKVYVASRIAGLVEEVNYEEGDSVRQGNSMARIDTRQQQIELRRAQVALEETRDEYERAEQLYESDAISRAEYLTARRNFEQAETDVDLLELHIEYGNIRAPVDGIVTARYIEIGNHVSENERVFDIAQNDMFVVRPGVSEMNLTGLQVGQPVAVRLDINSDNSIDGRIRRIFPESDGESRLFTVEVELLPDENTPVLRSGYLARVRFISDERREMITVPSEAVVRRNGETYVFVLSDDEDEVTLQGVEVGIQRDGYAEISTGIEAGQKVAAANLEALEDGAPVRVVGTFRRHGFRN